MSGPIIIPSLSHPDQFYEVRTHENGLSCTCPRFDFSPQPKACRHTDLVDRADRMLAKCAEQHKTQDGLCRKCVVALLAIATRRQREVGDAQFRAGKERGKAIVTNRRKKR